MPPSGHKNQDSGSGPLSQHIPVTHSHKNKPTTHAHIGNCCAHVEICSRSSHGLFVSAGVMSSAGQCSHKEQATGPCCCHSTSQGILVAQVTAATAGSTQVAAGHYGRSHLAGQVYTEDGATKSQESHWGLRVQPRLLMTCHSARRCHTRLPQTGTSPTELIEMGGVHNSDTPAGAHRTSVPGSVNC